ncbi:MAG: hypothetical protein YHS30scaffold667_64 [Phage 65_10]|nr:MAG: hypothetical protein YHS30scaffold667_64 [Phage 65_10]
MTHFAVGPDPAGRWHVARCLPGCLATGVMDCPTEALAQREAAILRGEQYAPRRVERLVRFEMYPDDIDGEVQRELHENYGMPRPDSPFAQPGIPF